MAPLVERPCVHHLIRCGDAAAHRRHGVPRIERVRGGNRSLWLFPAQRTVTMNVVWRIVCFCQWPVLYITPFPHMRESTVAIFLAVSAAHHKDSYGFLCVDAVVDPLQPPIEPPHPVSGIVVQDRIRAEVHIPGEGTSPSPVGPGPHMQVLRCLHHLRQSDIVGRCPSRVGIVPPAQIDGWDVGMFFIVVVDRISTLFPVVVEITFGL